jgi:drug/metabolite transporter (DMT)-like permease
VSPRTAPSRTSGGFLIVAAAAALWGSDALFRLGLALELPATAVVLGEHLVLVVLTLPLLVRGVRAARARFDRGDWLALLAVGAGASALATVLFTAAFGYGDPTTPLLLQKLQPLFAVAGARVVLGERTTLRYPPFFLAALAGAWLIAFPDPTRVSVTALAPALLAVAAAALWAGGTVLGRRLTARVGFGELTALRFGVGLPAAALLLLLFGDGAVLTGVTGGDALALVLLALVPGLLGISLYYRGLRRTPAALATLAELAFPLSAVVINYVAFGAVLTATQWLGLLLLAGTIAVLGRLSHRSPEPAGVQAPPREAELVGAP